jgi:hypothetical protein
MVMTHKRRDIFSPPYGYSIYGERESGKGWGKRGGYFISSSWRQSLAASRSSCAVASMR